MNKIVPIKQMREAPKAFRSKMDTIIFDRAENDQWRVPPCQRQLRVNEKVKSVVEELKHNGGVLPGIITLGKIGEEPTTYIVDGQHRLEAFKISGLKEAIADVRICNFESLGELAKEFVRLQKSLVSMRPDDVLRGLEFSTPAIKRIRDQCEFVGYDYVRRNPSSPIIGMSVVLRCWMGSAPETPSGSIGSTQDLAERITDEQDLIVFLLTAHSAWGRDPEFVRLWGSLNLMLCMWLYRRLVLDRDRSLKRAVILNVAQFKQCLMALSADSNYLDYLVGRMASQRDRAPTYRRIRDIFVSRVMVDSKNGKRPPALPRPPWVTT